MKPITQLILILLFTFTVSPIYADDFQNLLKHSDHKTALEKFRPMAEKGDSYAQAHMGWAYFHGNGVPKDYALAHMWYNLAATNGNEQGANGREQVEKLMTPAQIAEAQKLAREGMIDQSMMMGRKLIWCA